MNCPPMPFVAEEHHGSLVILASICWAGDADAGQQVMAAFIALAEPLANLVQPMPYPGMYPPEDHDYHPTAVSRTMFVQSIGVDEAALIVERLESSDATLRVAQLRGGPEVLEAPPGPVADACEGLRAVHALLDPDAAARVIFDLGLLRDLDYYTGAVFEVYDPALGAPIGGGGRYDDLLGRFGRPLPAVGFALGIDRLHIALAGEERR
jgi:hypothetical protein